MGTEATEMIRSLIEECGGVVKTAKRFGVTRQSVYNWIKHGEVGGNTAIAIERATCGKYKALNLCGKN